MTILLSNDDGYSSPGLQMLRKTLSSIAKVYVVAPDRERSAMSHKITLNHPIRIHQIEEDVFVSDASPADCVKAGFRGIIPEKIDLVVSGINNGPNMGTDVFYSGTVAVAREGVMQGVPGIALSLNSFLKEKNYQAAAEAAPGIIEQMMPHMNKPRLFNINFPETSPYRGIKITRLGFRVYKEKLIKNTDPMGNPYYWLGGELPGHNPRKGSDFEAIQEGYISVTPLTLDITNYRLLAKLNELNISLNTPDQE
jgi:5'-nucleotidase